MLADVLEDQLALNSTLPRTLVALLFRPGLLTQEYVRGRIVRYVAPFRLYLVASVVFFLIASFVGFQALDRLQLQGSLELDASTDSSRALLEAERAELAATDTTGMPPAARIVVRQTLRRLDAALAALPDTAALLDSASLARVQDLAEEELDLAPGTRQPWARDIQLETGTGWLNRAMQRKLEEVAHLPARDAARAVIRDLLTYAPHMVFLLLPVFAFLLQILYIRRGRYYAEHFVFALHVHAFTFVIMTLIFVLPWGWLDAVLFWWLVAYVWLALKRVYVQGWVRTTLKWWLLGWLYFWVFSFGLIALGVATLVLT